jgi:DNA-binding XRE family transcriptional regulator
MYNLLFIKKVLQKRKHYSIRKLAEKYDLSPQTIQKWEKGILPIGKRNKPNIKLNLDVLIEDVKKYPDAYQYERAKRLGVSETCIFHNLKKLGISYKKNTKAPKSRRREAIFIPKEDK